MYETSDFFLWCMQLTEHEFAMISRQIIFNGKNQLLVQTRALQQKLGIFILGITVELLRLSFLNDLSVMQDQNPVTEMVHGP